MGGFAYYPPPTGADPNDLKSHWIREFSQVIISEFLDGEQPLKEKLIKLVQVLRTKDTSKYDLAFTFWAQSDPTVRQLLDRVSTMRVCFIKDLLSKSGYFGAELESRARLFVAYFSYSENMFANLEGKIDGEPLDDILSIICDNQAFDASTQNRLEMLAGSSNRSRRSRQCWEPPEGR